VMFSCRGFGVKIGDFGWSFLPFLKPVALKTKNGRLIVNWNTEHRTQNTEHRTQNTEHRTQNTEHRTQNTDRNRSYELFCMIGAQYELPTSREGILYVNVDQSI
jgi:hypothetical protein